MKELIDRQTDKQIKIKQTFVNFAGKCKKLDHAEEEIPMQKLCAYIRTGNGI